MKNIHSDLLKSMPAAAKPKRARIPRRVLLIIFISAFIIIPAFIMITRALPGEGAGFIFYWIHDHIFLPIKGYTYTLFYPFSLSWWGPVLTALLIWLIAYIAMVSFIKDPHVSVLRKVIRRNPKKRHGVLIKTSGWLKKWKMEPLLLKEAVNMERKTTLNQLMSLPLSQSNETLVKRMVHLTQLHIDLMTLAPVKKIQEIHLESLFYWYQAYLQAGIRLQKNPQSEILKQLNAQLAEKIETLIQPLFDYKDETQLKEAREKPAGFDISSILVDLLYLGSLSRSSLAVLLLDSPTAVPGDAVKKAVLTRLAASVNKRRTILEVIRTRLEQLQKQKTGPYAAGDSETFEPILKGNIDIDMNTRPSGTVIILPVIARLALLIALHLSVLADAVSIGLGYMDSLETYDFVFNCLELEEGGEPASPYFTALQALNQLPEPGHYRLCGELAQLEINEYENLWKQSVLKEDGTIKPGDFELAKSRIESLLHSAGPGLDQHQKTTKK